MRYVLIALLLTSLGLSVRSAPAVPGFAQYPARRLSGKQAAGVDWSSNPDAARFKTRIKSAFAEGVKFAGHYAVASWGCGSDCRVMAIIDVRNGRVTYGPGAEFDFEFRRDSRLLIANSPAAVQDSLRLDKGCPDKDEYWAVTSHYYEWTGNRFRHIVDINPCAASTQTQKSHDKNIR